MIYVLELQYCDNSGGGIYGPYMFEDRQQAIKNFMDAVNNQFEDLNYRKDRYCLGAELYRVNYHEGKSEVLISYDDIGN